MHKFWFNARISPQILKMNWCIVSYLQTRFNRNFHQIVVISDVIY